jgi:hypothetical protein
MARKSGATKQHREVMEFLRLGGARVPAGLAAKAAASTKSRLQDRLGAATATRQQAAKLRGGLKGAATIDVDDPANAKVLDGLLGWHQKLAGKKLAFPRVPPDIGGFFPGRISGTIVPPFNFADSIPNLLANVSDPTLAVSASVNGQISASAVSAQARGFNGGGEYARVGIFFHPMTAGTLTISASPTYSFQWSTNSLNSNYVTSSGSVGLTIYGMTDMAQILATAGDLYENWFEDTTGQIGFDFGFDVQKSLSVSLNVTPALMYICFVEVNANVLGMGWPGSIATAKAVATVPSISYAFDAQPVLMA